MQYRNIIQDIMTPYSEVHYAGSPGLSNQVIFDTKNDHYLVVTIGWEGEQSVRDCVFHVDIIEGKIWIQEDNTDEDLCTMLVESGIPKSDIVLGFQSPSMRRFSSFAHA